MQASTTRRYISVALKRIDLERAHRRVLRNVDWHILPGQRWVLAGGNGAGKTQLLKLLAGAVWPAPTQGSSRRYLWRGEVWSTPQEVQEEIAYVGAERQDKYERYGWDHTVREIVGTGVYRTDIPLDALTARDEKRIHALLARLAIGHLAQRQFLSLSYGERRLTLLARALAMRPALLLLDELLNGLDALNRARALAWLERGAGSQLPWVLATHRVDDVPTSATHALVLERGRVVYRGPIKRAPLGRWLGPVSASADAKSRGARRTPAGRVIVRLTCASVFLDEHQALGSISLEVRGGQCWVVHGPNGSGKTTLIRTLYGDHGVAAGGRIERARIVPGIPLEVFKKRVGLIAPHLQTQHPRNLSVAEVVQSGRYAAIGLNAAPTRADQAAARRQLARFGLGRFAERSLGDLSYGQLRRVLFARAWMTCPRLLLLDEPFAGVDAPTRRALQASIDEFVMRGTAVVIATHHRAEWPRHTTHELELAAGRAVYVGSIRSA